MPVEHFKHIFLSNEPNKTKYTGLSTPGSQSNILPKPPAIHGAVLSRRFREAWDTAENERVLYHAERNGVYIEFISDAGAELITKSLEDMRSKKVRLLNVRTEEREGQKTTFATVFVANDKKAHFIEKIEAYATGDPERPPNAALANSIADIRKALLVDSFWQDGDDLVPRKERTWCEVWLRTEDDQVDTIVEGFHSILDRSQIVCAGGSVKFPERTVLSVFVNHHDLEQLSIQSDYIAEYRRAKETDFFVNLPNRTQAEWVDDLRGRIRFDHNSNIAVCIHDTGVNNGHPLLLGMLPNTSCLTVNPTWGSFDHHGHGTKMAGLAAYGNLQHCLEDTDPIHITHHLESVKIIPPLPDENPLELWGHISSEAVSRSEIEAPERKRIHCLAVAASDMRDEGRPSSWSGRLDQISSGADDEMQRLIIVSAGNAQTPEIYPASQLADSVHDPGQAWNVITVGAYTELIDINDPERDGYEVIAPGGGLSPFTTTSVNWDDTKWPFKPDIVMEGGNLSFDGISLYDESENLCLLTTSRDIPIRHFTSFNMTSAAAAQAAWMAAKIQAAYPTVWPETVRALMIHSADWTDQLKAQFMNSQNKSEFARMLRICGYGVPNLERALASAANSVSMVIEQSIQPFDKNPHGRTITREMHLYELPWPTDVLRTLPDGVSVKMRITLSYFVEPGPGEIGWKDRYRYASHALRFDVKSPTESPSDFVRRINGAARGEDGHPGTSSAARYWTIGSNGRDKGSVHSDIWTGTPQELADSGVIAVYPVIGWWRERAHLGRWDRSSRYSLIVTISTPEEDIDVYTPVAQQVGITIPAIIEI